VHPPQRIIPLPRFRERVGVRVVAPEFALLSITLFEENMYSPLEFTSDFVASPHGDGHQSDLSTVEGRRITRVWIICGTLTP